MWVLCSRRCLDSSCNEDRRNPLGKVVRIERTLIRVGKGVQDGRKNGNCSRVDVSVCECG